MRIPRTKGQALLAAMAAGASVWALVSPAFVLLPLFDTATAEGAARSVSASDAGKLGEALALLLTSSALGAAAFAATRLFLAGRRWAQLGMMGCAAGFFVLTVLTAGSVGPLLIGPAALLMFPALWLAPRGERAADG